MFMRNMPDVSHSVQYVVPTLSAVMHGTVCRSAVVRCLRSASIRHRCHRRWFSSTTLLSAHPATSFLSRFEQTAGPLPPHFLTPPPSPTSTRPPPPVVTRTVHRLPNGITRIALDIGVRDVPAASAAASADPSVGVPNRQSHRRRLPAEALSLASLTSTPEQRAGVDWVPCVLLVPPRPSPSVLSTPRYPAMLCLHQTTDPPELGKAEPTSPDGPLSYAFELTSRGYVTLSPDYVRFGEYHPLLSSVYAQYASVTAKAIANNVACVDFLTHYPLVGAAQPLGVVGHSLGASNALFTALYDARIHCVVSSAGFTSHRCYAETSRWHAAGRAPTPEEAADGAAYRGDMRGWARREKYMPLIESRFGNDWRRMPWSWEELLAELGRGGRRVFISAPKVTAVAAVTLWMERVALPHSHPSSSALCL